MKIWNYICQILINSLDLIMSKKAKTLIADSGLRGKFNGELYVDKKVFFKRDDVRGVIKSLKESVSLKEHIEKNRQELQSAH